MFLLVFRFPLSLGPSPDQSEIFLTALTGPRLGHAWNYLHVNLNTAHLTPILHGPYLENCSLRTPRGEDMSPCRGWPGDVHKCCLETRVLKTSAKVLVLAANVSCPPMSSSEYF